MEVVSKTKTKIKRAIKNTDNDDSDDSVRAVPHDLTRYMLSFIVIAMICDVITNICSVVYLLLITAVCSSCQNEMQQHCLLI